MNLEISQINKHDDDDINAALAANPSLSVYLCRMDIYELNADAVVCEAVAYVPASTIEDAEFVARKMAASRCKMVGLLDYINTFTMKFRER